MYANRQILWHHPPALTAHLGSIGRVHGNHRNTSTLSLVFQHKPKLSKPCIVRRTGEVSVSVHKCKRKIFDRNQVVCSDDLAAYLVEEIRSLIGDLLMQVRDLAECFSLALTALGLPGSMALQAAQFGKAFPQPARIVNQLSGRECGKGFQADINPNLPSVCGVFRFRLGKLQHQADKPAVVDPLDDRVLNLCLPWNGTMITHTHFTHVLHIEAHRAMLFLAQLAAISVGEFDALEAVAAFETWKARLFCCFQAAKESSKGFVQAAQQVLHARSVQLAEGFREGTALISKVYPLRPVIEPLACFQIDRDALFKSGVVDLSGLPEQEIQLPGLLVVWAKEVFVGAQHRLAWLLQFDEYLVLIEDTAYRTIVPIYMLFANKFGKEERASSAA